jgi:hypothetical protein
MKEPGMDALTEVRTAERFEAKERRRFAKGGYRATEEFDALANQHLPALVVYIEERLAQEATDLLPIKPVAIAKIGFAAVADAVKFGIDGPGPIIDIGRQLERELDRPFRRSEGDAFLIGHWVAECVVEALPDYFVRRGNVIELRDRGALERLREKVAYRDPAWAPTLTRPLPWTGLYSGGYADRGVRHAFVISYHPDTLREVDEAFKNGTIKPHADAASALQDVAFTINTRVLVAARRHLPGMLGAKVEECEKALKAALAMPMPAFEDITSKHIKARRSAIWQANTDWKAAKQQLELAKDDLNLAEDLWGEGFFTPMRADGRGRFNPIPHFNFQREDYVRAMHLFRDGEELTPRGFVWLAIHLANVFGFKPPPVEHADGTKSEAVSIDKASLAERFQWTVSNYPLIERTAREQTTEWLKARKPFAFLAACIEFVSALEANQPFITRLPIPVDATNSALQHQAALMRDEEAGALVNLCSQPIVCDLAGEWPWTHFGFAEWMLTTMPLDAPKDAYREIFLLVQGKTDTPLDRSLVKAPGMTDNYGSTRLAKPGRLMQCCASGIKSARNGQSCGALASTSQRRSRR